VKKLVVATRKSPLALAQSELVAAHLRATLGVGTELLRIVTTGDRRTDWSLEQKGGKGLFTGELEQSLLRGEADIAVHSTKDLPGDIAAGLVIAGYLPRADPRDVLVIRAGLAGPKLVATDSPRRRMQLALQFPGVGFIGIRGNVDTRLRKIAEGLADATVLAAAGMARLGIGAWEGLEFRPLEFTRMVPAVGQAAIAIQSRAADAAKFSNLFDAATARAVSVERALQSALGGGCHTAFGAHACASTLYFFHEQTGIRALALGPADYERPEAAAARILSELGLKPRGSAP
jgi:hydroxymethylbilane synthase